MNITHNEECIKLTNEAFKARNGEPLIVLPCQMPVLGVGNPSGFYTGLIQSLRDLNSCRNIIIASLDSPSDIKGSEDKYGILVVPVLEGPGRGEDKLSQQILTVRRNYHWDMLHCEAILSMPEDVRNQIYQLGNNIDKGGVEDLIKAIEEIYINSLNIDQDYYKVQDLFARRWATILESNLLKPGDQVIFNGYPHSPTMNLYGGKLREQNVMTKYVHHESITQATLQTKWWKERFGPALSNMGTICVHTTSYKHILMDYFDQSGNHQTQVEVFNLGIDKNFIGEALKNTSLGKLHDILIDKISCYQDKLTPNQTLLLQDLVRSLEEVEDEKMLKIISIDRIHPGKGNIMLYRAASDFLNQLGPTDAQTVRFYFIGSLWTNRTNSGVAKSTFNDLYAHRCSQELTDLSNTFPRNVLTCEPFVGVLHDEFWPFILAGCQIIQTGGSCDGLNLSVMELPYARKCIGQPGMVIAGSGCGFAQQYDEWSSEINRYRNRQVVLTVPPDSVDGFVLSLHEAKNYLFSYPEEAERELRYFVDNFIEPRNFNMITGN